MRFDEKIVIVTGAASGFGEAIAKRFAAEGAKVVVADVDAAGGNRVVGAIRDAGGQAVFVRTDVSKAAEVKAMIDAAVAQYGGLDILVNNAGFSHHMMPLWELPEDEYDRVFSVNTKGVYLGAKYAVPVLRERGGGVIVNTASIGAVAPRPGVTAYNATKGRRRDHDAWPRHGGRAVPHPRERRQSGRGRHAVRQGCAGHGFHARGDSPSCDPRHSTRAASPSRATSPRRSCFSPPTTPSF